MSLISCGNWLIHFLSLVADGSVSLWVFNNPYCVHSMILRYKDKKRSEKYLVCVPYFLSSVFLFISSSFLISEFFLLCWCWYSWHNDLLNNLWYLLLYNSILGYLLPLAWYIKFYRWNNLLKIKMRIHHNFISGTKILKNFDINDWYQCCCLRTNVEFSVPSNCILSFLAFILLIFQLLFFL